MALTSKTPANTYKDLLTIENSNNGVDSTLKNIRTGNGSNTSATISDRALAVKSATNNTTAFDVQNASGTSRLLVDTTNDKVKALGNYVNTQYAYFGISGGINSSWTNNTHYPVSFAGNNHSVGLQDNLTFGTGTDPLTAFTTADGTNTDASLLVPFMWYVPDSISIDNVYSLEGMTTSSANVTRMHLYSFDFTSGSTSALTSGTTLAHNTDVTNAGSEQAYLSSLTVDSATVTSGKVIVATFRQDGTNADYSVNITVKYHLT